MLLSIKSGRILSHSVLVEVHEDTEVPTEVQETYKRTKVIKLSHHSSHVIGKPVYGLPYGSVSRTLRNIAYINRGRTRNKQYCTFL